MIEYSKINCGSQPVYFQHEHILIFSGYILHGDGVAGGTFRCSESRSRQYTQSVFLARIGLAPGFTRLLTAKLATPDGSCWYYIYVASILLLVSNLNDLPC